MEIANNIDILPNIRLAVKIKLGNIIMQWVDSMSKSKIHITMI